MFELNPFLFDCVFGTFDTRQNAFVGGANTHTRNCLVTDYCRNGATTTTTPAKVGARWPPVGQIACDHDERLNEARSTRRQTQKRKWNNERLIGKRVARVSVKLLA